MKRLRVDDTTVKEVVASSGGTLTTAALFHHRQTLAAAHHQNSAAVVTAGGGGGPQLTAYPTGAASTGAAVAAAAAAAAVKVVGEAGMQSSLYGTAPPVSYGQMPTAAVAPHSGKPTQAMQPLTVAGGPPQAALQESPQPQQQQSQFQRLKVEDALSYLDLVKFKFGSKPQVYNDFLDIMKEFKSQSIDTPGVIQRVSNLFKGFPELIVGFNTFLPPGYKIEVQRSDQGYAFQVSVSVPSPTGTMNSDPTQQKQMIMRGSGPINMSGSSQPPPQQPPVQSLSLAGAQHLPPQAAPQPAPAPAPVHHTGYGGGSGGAPTYNTLSLSAAQAAVSQALGHTDAPQNQPVEFNHAINYVNKIKNRFQGQPEKYKRFLEILHTYQKEQRNLKESSGGVGGGKHLTEQEVYSQVAKLFENQSDLLAEFGQFLPDATSHINQAPLNDHHSANSLKKQPAKTPYRTGSSTSDMLDRHHHVPHKPSHMAPQGVKRSSPPYQSNVTHHRDRERERDRDVPPAKKHKSSTSKDITIAEAGKYATLNDYGFFDKLRKAVRTQEAYTSFLRCLILFNQEILSKSELVQLVTPFLTKFPELLRWFRDFLGQNEVEPIQYNISRSERPQGDHALEIDLTTAKRLGASYCVIPPSQEGLRCSGRTSLCKDVLNDQWVSFPTWSEDSTFVSSRKTQYEEYMYRCEDERFELDVVIETNASTIRVLEGVHKKLSRMNAEDVAKYRLDDCLGGNSPTLHQRALKRIYGDKAADIIDGLKRNPAVAVPVVLRRLKTKEEEWREAQKGFNKIWREQNEKYYLKSLDHQGINFKQTDVKALRSKSLFNEIESQFDERHENTEDGAEPAVGPHLVIHYKDRTILDDAANLLVHHVKRQTGIQKSEKRRIKHLLFQFIPDLFFHRRQPLSDDEEPLESLDLVDSPSSSPSSNGKNKKSPSRYDYADIEIKMEESEETKVPLHAQTSDPEEAYNLFMANNNWYVFLRLHAILCDRLAKIYERAVVLATEESKQRTNRKESTAVALRLKPKPQIEVEDYYPAFLDMVKNLLDGNMDANNYEDTLREMFGIHAYIAFTLDKVVSYAVRQLQHCVTERTALMCSELFTKRTKYSATGGPCATAHRRMYAEMCYQKEAERIVQDENCFKIFIYKNEFKMSIELLDTEPEDGKKVEDVKEWNTYKDNYVDYSSTDNIKLRSPVYLDRNLRMQKKRAINNSCLDKKNSTRNNHNEQKDDGVNKRLQGCREESSSTTRNNNDNKMELMEELERKLNERSLPERNVSNHPGYDVSEDTECRFNLQDSKIMLSTNKDSYLYKIGALAKAKKSHSHLTKKYSHKFRTWLKKWVSSSVTDIQLKHCTDWLMGRGEGVVPNRTRVLTDNDLSRTPYVSYNRYRVEKLSDETT